MEPTRTDYLVGAINAEAIAATYQCGHCNSETSLTADDAGIHHIAVHHDDGCPVLTGALPSAPDVARALTRIPDTFKTRPS
jgi:hypothetical protein